MLTVSRSLAVALVSVSVLLFAGCGGGGEETEERTLTKAQFVNLTEKFCDREYKAEERDMRAYAKKHDLVFGGGEPWEQERLHEAIVFDYVRDKIDYFKSLPAPEGDEKEVQAMIRAFERGLIASEVIPESLAEPRPGQDPLRNPFEASYRTTSEYGPWLCGQP